MGAVLRGVRFWRRAAHAQPQVTSRPGGVDRRRRGRRSSFGPDVPAVVEVFAPLVKTSGLRRDDQPGHMPATRRCRTAVLRGTDRHASRRNSLADIRREHGSSLCSSSARPATPRARSTATVQRSFTATPGLPTLDAFARHDPTVVPMFHVNAGAFPTLRAWSARSSSSPARGWTASRCRDCSKPKGDRPPACRPSGRACYLCRRQRPEVQHHEAHRHRRIDLPAGHDGCLRGQVRRPGDPRLGNDRAEPDGCVGQAQGQACEPGRGAAPGTAGEAGALAVRH